MAVEDITDFVHLERVVDITTILQFLNRLDPVTFFDGFEITAHRTHLLSNWFCFYNNRIFCFIQMQCTFIILHEYRIFFFGIVNTTVFYEYLVSTTH